ncbi:glycoside hydrolase family protein [Sphingobium yanoikuyae]|nr:glycoside hydrolase family protein [Sphingobium yanoikuyae]
MTAHEGEILTAYLCPARVWTIGVGHTGPEVKKGLKITKKESQALLEADLARFEAAVNRGGDDMTQNQFDALVSFAFNVGTNAFALSTLLRKHRSGDYTGAAKEFARWTKGGGRVLPGLVKRRAAEATLYLS